ncbi:MAG: hypothetical protein HKN11_17325 [Rhizobiales bacterium]|nr:hypothetical protein [Hyphomicrobiales bacterium]
MLEQDISMKLAYRIIAVLIIGGSLVLAAGAYALGIASYERYSGYFAPVWDEAGKAIYYLQRDTSGFIWGMGWEHFTPPASSYITSDDFSLRRIDVQSGEVEILQAWPGSPLSGRTTKHYRGRIFNGASARVERDNGAVKFTVVLQIPKVPRSDIWALSGTWRPDVPAAASWQQTTYSSAGISNQTLQNGVEVFWVRGRESFPSAIVTVDSNGKQRVVLHNDDFDDIYPDGIPQRHIDERSRRASIERSRLLKKTRAELIAKHMAAGLREGEARLKSTEDMEELGLLPKRPRLVAKTVSENPDNLKVFDIPPDYFTVGLFTDIAAAIADPGKLVDTSTGGYLKYYDDDVGPRLRAWREAGNDRFIVRTGSKTYLLEVRRFK